ncbi:hypothetical protein [Novosphingobium guangzhouense]|uniref:Uncharacterized protein n=1 Tax=Novosphingobium guangzhouense TaxID=1850347 RepID=A0A2K2G202_9SPHN|nr:hypothetical protein [Novosphingobium guangzhouense]PNU05054.1 hypothetical protein A8V01_04270 [Novosphingobium guangzhouense]
MQSELVRGTSFPFATGRARGPWLRLLSEVLNLAGPSAEFLRHSERDWASATFSGARHTVALTFDGAAAVAHGEAFMTLLPDHEFTVPRHIVADAAVTSVEQTQAPARMTLEVELLVLQDF